MIPTVGFQELTEFFFFFNLVINLSYLNELS